MLAASLSDAVPMSRQMNHTEICNFFWAAGNRKWIPLDGNAMRRISALVSPFRLSLPLRIRAIPRNNNQLPRRAKTTRPISRDKSQSTSRSQFFVPGLSSFPWCLRTKAPIAIQCEMANPNLLLATPSSSRSISPAARTMRIRLLSPRRQGNRSRRHGFVLVVRVLRTVLQYPPFLAWQQSGVGSCYTHAHNQSVVTKEKELASP